MSQENVEPVRHSLQLRERSGRTLEQRVAMRLPWFAGLWLRLMARLPPRSRLRQALLLRASADSMDAINRGDFEAVLLGYHPDVEFEQALVGGGYGELGFQASYRGHEGFRKFQADWHSHWAEIRYEPQELIDLGDRILVLMQGTVRGEASGASVTQPMAILATFNEHGKVIRERRFFDHTEALAAAGLSE